MQGTWWVAHTKARNEKALASQMIHLKIQYFLPLIQKVHKRSRRVFRTMLPLFSGYVFFCGDEQARLSVLKTNRTAKIIAVTDQQRLIDELYPIEQALRNGFNLLPCEYVRPGQRCRIMAGPLMGTEGILVKTQNQTRLVLQVDMLGQASSLEIDADMLEPVN